jgi:RHS repeat-associated protein
MSHGTHAGLLRHGCDRKTSGPVVDAESGLVYLRARYYDPATGQFLNRDPIVAITGEPYAYAGNDPLNGTDPMGLNKCEAGWNPLRWGGNAADCASKARSPDYVTVSLSGSPLPFLPPFIAGGSLTLTRDGHVYVGDSAGGGVPGLASLARVGWLNRANPSNCQIDSFVGGNSVTGDAIVPIEGIPGLAGIGPSFGETFSSPGSATEIGAGISAGRTVAVTGSHSSELFQLPSWLRF